MGRTFSFIICLLCLFLSAPAEAVRMNPERFYQRAWCEAHNGEIEHILPDKTRIDCLTAEYAIEFDFADKFYESIGQALYYSEITGLKPGVVLILENPDKEYRYLSRLKTAVQGIDGFKVWIIHK